MSDVRDTIVLLKSLIDHYGQTLNGQAVQAVADTLNRVDGKASWSRRYVLSVANETLAPSRRLARAIEATAASLDDVPVRIARAEQVNVLSEPGDIRPGSYVMGRSQVCARPGCAVVFVPNHPRRIYCPVCSPPRK